MLNISPFQVNLHLLLNICSKERKYGISVQSSFMFEHICEEPLQNWAHEQGQKWLHVHRKWTKKKWRPTLIETTFRAVMGRHSKINPSILGILIAAISGELKLFKPLCQTEGSCLFSFCQQQWECLPKWNQTTGVCRNSWRDYLIFWLKPHFFGQLVYLPR